MEHNGNGHPREEPWALQLTAVGGDIVRGGKLSRFAFTLEESRVSEMEQILAKSRAMEPFKRAVRSYSSSGGGDHIRVDGSAPSIKVRRLLAHILTAEPHLPIERVSLRGRSGCSDFVGTVKVHTASETRVYEFVWDCRWRAEQEGWTDCFGYPDQIRAAREYDWRCFERWEAVHVDAFASHTLE